MKVYYTSTQVALHCRECGGITEEEKRGGKASKRRWSREHTLDSKSERKRTKQKKLEQLRYMEIE